MQDESRPFIDLLFEEAELVLEKAKNTRPDNPDLTFIARTFHRMAEAWLQKTSPENLSDYDVSAVAQTAEEYFKKCNPFFGQFPMTYLMGHMLAICLQNAFQEESRKIVFPVWDYFNNPLIKKDVFDDYDSGYDPLALHKFTQRVLGKGVLRVRGDDNEIFEALREFNESQFPVVSTREEFVKSLADLPVELAEWQIDNFDKALAAQPTQTPEVVAQLLFKIRTQLVRDYTLMMFQGFIDLGDHGIRCGISATLFLAALYAKSNYAEAINLPEKTIAQSRPTLTDVKKIVARYFADWLTQPLATKPREVRQANYELSGLDKQFQKVKPLVDRAKKCYTKNKDEDNWRELVKALVPDLPDDLVNRLGSRVNDRENQPRSIALEWAARISGMSEGYIPNYYDTAYLSKRLNKIKQP